MISLQQLLKACVTEGASDLHLVAGSSPALRVDGRIIKVKSKELSPEEVQQLCYSLLTEGQKSYFEEHREIDFSFGVKKIARFRVNYFYQKGMISAAFRRIPLDVPKMDELKLPGILKEFIDFPHGLVLVTGPTGAGKSTSLAAMINEINEQRRGHIITIEDPIEYIHEHKKCIVNQREIKSDTEDFSTALKYILRQDPDVCLLGELRDPESLEAALNIAETGHLVFATMHTNSAVETINRAVSMFSEAKQDQVRSQLSFVLQGILSQRLLPRPKGGMIACCEVMMLNAGIRSLIRENKIHQIYGMMQLGQDRSGMQTMNQALMGLILKRKIDMREAFKYSPDPEELDQLLKKAGI